MPASVPKVRIIAGKWRGKQLPIVRGHIRPTTDRIRETLFNWVAMSIPNARCLDLYAGTGVLGLECLSRNAAHATFIEKDKVAAKAIQGALQELTVSHEQASVHTDTAEHFIRSHTNEPYNLIFSDPPYQAGALAENLHWLLESNCVADNAMIFFEQSKKEALPDSTWIVHRQKSAGEVVYGLWKNEVSE